MANFFLKKALAQNFDFGGFHFCSSPLMKKFSKLRHHHQTKSGHFFFISSAGGILIDTKSRKNELLNFLFNKL